VLLTEEVIEEYSEDKPFPSRLILGFVGQKPLHVVAGFDEVNRTVYVITAYKPDKSKFQSNLLAAIFLFSILFSYPSPALAKVAGDCINCHSAYNRQAGTGSAGPFRMLLLEDCLGCHTGANDGTNTTPYVCSTAEPTFGGNTLAGGNFYWVKTDDTKGHNVFAGNPDGDLSVAPGDVGFSGCGTDNCHKDLYSVVGTDVPIGLQGRQGCTKCHMVSNAEGPSGFHHRDDGTGTKYVNTAAQGWYRFLSGHMSGDGHGVTGIEHEKWNYGATAGSHNEYSGNVIDGGYGFFALDKTMTAYCTGCHGRFHDYQGSGSAWIRHPSDVVIPNSGEYQYAYGAADGEASGAYDPNVPAARPIATFNWAGGPSATVTPGADLVMCLSCHVAHGSPYPHMLRWDYDGMIAGGGGADGTGCFVCHTGKDGV
jgi:hypothetical protein